MKIVGAVFLSLTVLSASVPAVTNPQGFTSIDNGYWKKTFDVPSPSNKSTRQCMVIVPPDYFTSTQKYPVVYHLNGVTGSESSGETPFIRGAMPAIARGTAKPMIFVGVDAGQRTMCADSKDGTIMIETFVNKEAIPWVDSKFRTFGDAAHRGIEGNSQGGYGALLYLNKYPELYGSVVAYCAALHSAEALAVPGVQIDHGHDLGEVIGTIMFDNDVEYARRYNPWNTYDLHPAKSRRVPVFMLVGQGDSFYKKDSLYAHVLDSMQMPLTFLSVPNTAHGVSKIMQNLSNPCMGYEFHSKNFDKAATSVVVRNGPVAAGQPNQVPKPTLRIRHAESDWSQSIQLDFCGRRVVLDRNLFTMRVPGAFATE